MSIYGAEFVLTPAKRNERSHRKSEEMSEELPNAWLPLQFDNPANIEIHKTATAQEIIKDFPDGLDYMIGSRNRWSYHWLC
jgi:cysteine synthase A